MSSEAAAAAPPASPASRSREAGEVTVSTPGKLILAGEHAVVYGGPALVGAVDLRLSARFSPADRGQADRGILLDLPGISCRQEVSWAEIDSYARLARERWEHYAAHPEPASFRALRGGDPLHLVKAALGEAARHLGETAGPPLALRVESDLPAGSGMGSSAATAVALVAGYLTFRAGGSSPVPTLPDVGVVERLALEVERRQHGSPSGVDVATVLHGGLLGFERQAAGNLAATPVAPRSPLLGSLAVFHTGEPPEPTGEVVAAVAARRAAEPARVEAVLDRIAMGTRVLAALLASAVANPAAALDAIRLVEAALEELGVVPAPVRQVVRRIEAAGGAAKISGAGSLAGPAAGMLLVYDPDSERAAAWPFLSAFSRCAPRLGAAGLRLEPLP